MTIWDSICHSQWFKQTSIVNHLLAYFKNYESLINDPSDQILFLNKNDLFERKIPTSDIKSFFPVSLSPLLTHATGDDKIPELMLTGFD